MAWRWRRRLPGEGCLERAISREPSRDGTLKTHGEMARGETAREVCRRWHR